MPLTLAAPCVPMTIRRVTGSDKVRLHLQNLGFIEGETVTVINKVDHNVIIKLKGVSLAMTVDMAKQIFV